MNQKYHVIGLMSGTSLDGLDIAHCSFELNGSKWTYQINVATTVSYPDDLYQKLSRCTSLSSDQLETLSIKLGKWYGEQTKGFIDGHQLATDFIASHGHTVFHQPEKGITLQIGTGEEIARITGVTTINDFRSKDVSLGGQGAPLVPIGDRLLFSEYDACLNLGGIANISMEKNGSRIAYDIVPFNLVFNFLANKLNKPYDNEGAIAASGEVDEILLPKLNELNYYQQQPPKSLGIEWIMDKIHPLLEESPASIQDQMHTCCLHIAEQIVRSLPEGNILISGGGAYNAYFIEQLKSRTSSIVTIAHSQITQYKEALIFAFLGVLRFRSEINCLKSVTGASSDSSGGVIHHK